MLSNKKITTFIVLCLLVSATTYGQNEKLRQMVRKSISMPTSTLSKLTLQKATSIEYSADMGSVPEWHDCKIIVKKNSVRVRMTKDYEPDNVVTYDKTFSLSADKYQKFITSLANQSIKKTKPIDRGVGGGSSRIKVCKGSSTLFKGDEKEDLTVSSGELIDSFLKVIPSDVARKVLVFMGQEYKTASFH